MVCRLFSVGALVVALSGLAACGGGSGTKATQCKSTTECPSGEICNLSQCTKTCDSATLCPGGYDCQNGLCTSGLSSGSPVITSVAGMSTQSCGENGACIGTGFVVTGEHLSATAFTLTGPGDDVTQYATTRADGGNSDTGASLVPVLKSRQTDLLPGTYTLAAVNASGSTTFGLSLLQGEPGPAMTGDQIIGLINGPSVTSTIRADRVNITGSGGGGGESNTFYTWKDQDGGSGFGGATTTTLPNRRMQIIVSADVNAETNGPPVSRKIDQAALQALCGAPKGCEVTLGATGFDASTTPKSQIDAELNGGVCRFFWTNGSWTLSENCTHIYRVMAIGKDNNGNNVWVDMVDDSGNPAPYQPYLYANTFGQGGSSKDGVYTCTTKTDTNIDPNDVDTKPLVIMSFKGACYFAESPADTNPAKNYGCFTADTDAEFYLTASSKAWDDQGFPSKWTGTGRTCVLTIRD